VVKFDKARKFIKEWVHKDSVPGERSEPRAVAMGSQGRLFAGDREYNRVQILTRMARRWTNGFGRASGICVTGDDTINVACDQAWPTRYPR
jgi:hypothetical protein